MAIAFVTSFKQGSTNGFTTSSFDSTGANFGVVCLTGVSGASINITSDSKSNTWLPLTESQSPVFNRSCRLWYAYNITAGTGHTVTVTGASQFMGLTAMFFSGALATDPLGATQGAGGVTNGTTFAIGSITPSENNCLVVAGLMYDTGTGLAINSGLTIPTNGELTGSGGAYLGSGIAYIIQTTAGAVGPTWSWTTDNNASGASAFFKAAGAAAQDTPELRGRPFGLHGQAQMHQLLSQ